MTDAPQSVSEDTKLVYIKRWRTLVKLPAKYADEIVEALRDVAQAEQPWGKETWQVTDADREYASELLADLTSDDLPRHEIAARWFRKARVEHSRRTAQSS